MTLLAGTPLVTKAGDALIAKSSGALYVTVSTGITLVASTVGVTGPGALTVGAGQSTGSGNNTLLTPAAGKRIRGYYFSYNPVLAAEIGFRFGSTGTIFLQNNITANSVISKDMGDLRFVQGGVDEPLLLNQSLGITTDWTVFYLEV